MVWARAVSKNDFDHWAKEAGDDAWGYRHAGYSTSTGASRTSVAFRIPNGAVAARFSFSLLLDPKLDRAGPFLVAAGGVWHGDLVDQNGVMQVLRRRRC